MHLNVSLFVNCPRTCDVTPSYCYAQSPYFFLHIRKCWFSRQVQRALVRRYSAVVLRLYTFDSVVLVTPPCKMGLLVAKIFSMMFLGVFTWLVGLFPILGVRKGWVSESESQQTQVMVNVFSFMTCFGGGVILTSCLTHMLPDVNEVLATAIQSGAFPDSGLPVAEIFVLAGFLMIYMLEEVLHHLLLRSGLLHQEEGVQSKQGGHGHSHDNVQIAPSEEGIQVMIGVFLQQSKESEKLSLASQIQIAHIPPRHLNGILQASGVPECLG